MGLLLTQTTVVEAVFHDQVDAAQISQWLDGIEQLIERRQPFFFISTTRESSTFAEDYRAIQGVWYRQHKAAFREICVGLVRIASDAENWPGSTRRRCMPPGACRTSSPSTGRTAIAGSPSAW